MKTMLKSYYGKPVAVSLIVALLALSSLAAPAEAMYIPVAPGESTPASSHLTADRSADLARVQSALESKIIRQKLMDYGLSPDAAMTRVNALSDQQLHELAAHTDSVQAGGDPGDFLVGVVVVAVLVVVLVYLLQGRIEVK